MTSDFPFGTSKQYVFFPRVFFLPFFVDVDDPSKQIYM